MILGPKTKNWKMRVVAVDHNGGIRMHQKASGTPSETSTTWTMSFGSLTKEQVREFRIQVRPLEWVEFHRVALHPSAAELGAVASPKTERTEWATTE